MPALARFFRVNGKDYHHTPEHTLLNMQAADVLREAGYQVKMTTPEIALPDGGLFRLECDRKDARRIN